MPDIPDRDDQEAAYAKLLAKLLKAYGGRLLERLGDPPDLSRLTPAFWDTETGRMLAELRPQIEAMARDAMLGLAAEIGVAFEWGLVAEQAAAWAERYAYDLVTGIVDTTRKVVQRKVAEYVRTPGRTIGDLRADLAPHFGEIRAQMIAVTETTRAYAQGTLFYQQALAQAGVRMVRVWHTSRDEKVCPICNPPGDPLEGKTEDKWPAELAGGPPAHVSCRCWTTLTLAEGEGT